MIASGVKIDLTASQRTMMQFGKLKQKNLCKRKKKLNYIGSAFRYCKIPCYLLRNGLTFHSLKLPDVNLGF